MKIFLFPDASKNWIRDTFSVNVYELEGLRAAEKDRLIEISTDGGLKFQAKVQSLPNFWVHLQADFPELTKRTMKVLMPFICKKSFSAFVYLKNKHRNIESELRIQVSPMNPDITRLVSVNAAPAFSLVVIV